MDIVITAAQAAGKTTAAHTIAARFLGSNDFHRIREDVYECASIKGDLTASLRHWRKEVVIFDGVLTDSTDLVTAQLAVAKYREQTNRKCMAIYVLQSDTPAHHRNMMTGSQLVNCADQYLRSCDLSSEMLDQWDAIVRQVSESFNAGSDLTIIGYEGAEQHIDAVDDILRKVMGDGLTTQKELKREDLVDLGALIFRVLAGNPKTPLQNEFKDKTLQILIDLWQDCVTTCNLTQCGEIAHKLVELTGTNDYATPVDAIKAVAIDDRPELHDYLLAKLHE